MAVDTPAKIVVIGAGPIGLEAALYARFLGYDVAIYERGRVADNVVQRCGNQAMATPWRMMVTSLGLAALRAQDTLWQPPAGDTLLTGREWAAQYLVPLSQTDLLADNLYERTEVLTVAREDLPPGESVDEEDDEDGGEESSFTLRLRDAAGRERTDTADVVIDAAGVVSGARPASGIEVDEVIAKCGPSPDGPVPVADGEPGYYVLGAKSYAGRADYLISTGHQQIRDLFAIIGDRVDLDLYKSMARAEI
jgi:2-polyprenyl-6-methoxyphenol hydroxylase-like FAD-dependent oxidoreductase